MSYDREGRLGLPSVYHNVQAKCVVELCSSSAVCRGNVEASRSEDDAERDPETTVRGQGSGTKGVVCRKLPEIM